ETDGDLRYVRVSAPFDPWVTRIVRLMMGLCKRRRIIFSSSLYFRQYYSQIAKHMAEHGIEVAHIHSIPQAASIIRSFYPSVKIVVHLHIEWLSLLPPHLAREQFQDADLVLGCSEYVSEKMRQASKDYSAKIRTVYNAVDVDRFYQKQRDCLSTGIGRRLLLV